MEFLNLFLILLTVVSCSKQAKVECQLDGYALEWSDEFEG
jgi:hypothetical protein